jgi:CheY-like chemotaxis protein
MLKAQGYQTVEARNGKEGLTVLAETPNLQLIITDYMMPEMDGLEFIEQIRASPTLNQIPIVVASAHADLETVKRVKGLQCDGFLVKPIKKQDLLKRVEQIIGSEQRVLLAKHEIMDRLEIGQMEYHDLIKTLAAQLAVVMPILVLEQGDSDEPISKNLGQLLKEIAESASMLGADKFKFLYSKCLGRHLPARSQCAALLKELQELDRALLSYLQTEPNVAQQS